MHTEELQPDKQQAHGTLFDRLLEQVHRRISNHRRSCQPDTVLSEEAIVEAAELWQSAQPANPEDPTPEDHQRLTAARDALGWLHFLRHMALPEGPEALSELARAIVYFAPMAYDAAVIPKPLRAVMGADTDTQANVAAQLVQQSLIRNDPVLLDAVIWLLATSITATPHDHPDRAGRLSNLGLTYQQRYMQSGVLTDLEQAVETLEEAVAATPEGHPDRPLAALPNLGLAYHTRFAHSGVLADLDLAIETFKKAMAATPEDHPNRPGTLSNLGNAYRVRYGLGGVLADLEQAIELGALAVAATPADHPHRAVMLSNLGDAYRSRFERCGILADLDEAVERGTQAVAAIPRNHPLRAASHFNLSVAHLVRYMYSGVADDLEQAVETGTEAVSALPDSHPDRAAFLSNLGGTHKQRYDRSGTPADLEQAIATYEQAVAALPGDHPGRPSTLSNLGNAYQARFDRGGVPSDLEQAVELCARAVAAASPNHPHLPAMLSHIGIALKRRFERYGELADLERAIENLEEAVAITPEGHPKRASFLSDLGDAYKRRYERNGTPTDIEQAIKVGSQAVAAAPDDHADRAKWLFNIGNAYLVRFERDGVLADLDLAIEFGTQAKAAASHSDANRAVVLSGLGLAHRMRFELSGVPSDITQAIDVSSQAIAMTPEDHPNRAMYSSGLGIALQARFEHSEVLADVDLAIEAGRQAVAASPDDYPQRALFLSNLGTAYTARFARSEAPSDIEQAIQRYEQAVAATADDHTNQAKWLFNLGNAYLWRKNVCRQDVDSQTLLTLVRRVTAATTGPPVYRVQAARVAGWLALTAGEHRIAVELLDTAVGMLPSVAPREGGWVDHERRLGRHLGLAGQAVAAHCAINNPVGAIEAAELGRGIMLAAQMNSRSDLTDLDHAHPDLATQFRLVRDRLNIPQTADVTPALLPVESAGRIEHRKRLWAEHDQVVAQIRHQPGFDRFLQPPRLADLKPATTGGAAVLVNTGQSRSDAIIITAEADPVHVPLPDVEVDEIVSRALEFQTAIHDSSPLGILRRQRVMRETLGWLWDTVVEHILKKMPPTASGTRTSTLRRVWWLPTGPLDLFPLHAAGHLGHPGALDFATSSYIPTLRALAHARTRPAATVRRQLTIALHHTPGLPYLPGTVAEAATLHAHHPGTPLLLDKTATTSRVLTALPEATWAHFACHAMADPAIPSRGGLVLHDATLALPDISRLQLGHAELAYLSACSTAGRGLQLADESLHLASAFHLAGFRHVIASLWPLDDSIAAEAAAAFYQHMPATPTADYAANALHHVICQLREEHPDRPDLWAALIHSGP